MPIIKAQDQIEAYRALAQASDISKLSGRGHRRFLTEFVSKRILSVIDLRGGETLLDVGCGDGTLILEALAAGASGRIIGVLPTIEEVERVQDLIATDHPEQASKLTIVEALAEDLQCADGSVDVLVCNSVLHMAGRTKEAASQAIKEFARVVAPGGKIYIGELPDRDEFAGEDYGTTAFTYLRGVYRHQGRMKSLKTALRMLRSAFGAKPFIYGLYGSFHATPESFAELLGEHGIEVERAFKHRGINRKGVESDSQSRWNYLCRKQ